MRGNPSSYATKWVSSVLCWNGYSLEIVQALCKEGKCRSLYGHLINDAKVVLQAIPQWEAHHVRRNLNVAAHRLVKMAMEIGDDCVWVDSIPDFIQDIVNDE